MPPTNVAPVVRAGTNQAVIQPASASLNGFVSDDGQPGPLTVTWSVVSGPGSATFGDSHTAVTTASFSTGGVYVLQLAADDGQVTTVGQLTVTVITRPVISIQLLSNAVQMSWLADVPGWRLQAQTNPASVGLGTNWMDVPGEARSPFVVPINPASGAVFLRLVLPQH
jgi:hypothetical protein